MTKKEALGQMRAGKLITHRYFSPNEHMTIINNKIVLEDGVKCSIEEFFKHRMNDAWDDGYEFYKG